MVPPNNLGPDLNGKYVNETQYKGMIRSLMYLTASKPDIQFLTCLCARYQANPKESYLIVVKRIFRYLKGTPSLGFWYPKCSGFDLKEYSDSNYVGRNMDRKSTSAEAEYVAAAGCCANIFWMKIQVTDYDIIYMRRDHIMKGDIELHFIITQYQLADIFTKPLDEPNFKRLIIILVKPIAFEAPNSSSYIKKKDINPSQPLASTPVVAGMHKEVQQATTSTIVISESTLRHGALVDFTVEADLGKSAPNDSLSQQQGIDKGTKIYSFDHIITGTNPNVLVDKTKSSRDGLETIHTETGTDKEASKVEKEVSFDQYEFDTSLELTSFEDAKEIKMEDLSKLVKDARKN
ncbi:hypothetical protein Tco_0039400 [Tanacetum coccineum]